MTDPHSDSVSAEQFGIDYATSLQSLTFNSRPIIESHTLLAQENTAFANEIVSAIERRIEKAIPSQKLFALYLLDSISKNIGLPYTSLFSNNLFKTFTQTYGLVDDQTRCKLIKLFKTWKLPTALTGLPLFDSNQLDKIEQFLIKVTAASNPGINLGSSNNHVASSASPVNHPSDLNRNNLVPSPSSPFTPALISSSNSSSASASVTPTASPFPKTKTGLIQETDELISLVNARLKSVPTDEKGQQRFKLLNQLKSILGGNSNIPQTQLNEVSKQLQSIREDEVLKLNVLKQQQQRQQQQQQQQQFSASSLQNLLNLSNSGNNGLASNATAQTLFNMMSSVMGNASNMSSMNQHNINNSANNNNSGANGSISTLHNLATNNPDNTSNPLGLKNISFLENILKKSGTQSNISSTPKVDFKFIKPTKKSIVEDFELTQSVINNHVPTNNEISLLYEFKPVQCPYCPKRFADSEEGERLKNNHFEWHERVKQRMRLGGGGLGGVVNRSWYLTDTEWIEFNDDTDSVDGKTENISAKATVRIATGSDVHNHKTDSNSSTNGARNKVTGSALTDDTYRDRSEEIDLSDAPNHVVKIPESSSNDVVCGICRDKLVGIFDEDNGEWIWRNAIQQKGKVWHWTCWMETKNRTRRERSPQR